MPILVKDILNATDGKIVIEGHEVHMVTFIGVVELIEIKQTNIMYTIQDDTGSILVVQWIEKDMDVQSEVHVKVRDFCRVLGLINVIENRRFVRSLRISNLSSANEITTHLLETMWIRMKMRLMNKTKQHQERDPAPGQSGTHQNASLPFVAGLSPQQKSVFEIIRQGTSLDGTERSYIHRTIIGVKSEEVDYALNYLCSQRHICSTIDEHHFKVFEL